MIYKIVISGLVCLLMIEKLKHIAELKAAKPKLTIEAIDGLIAISPIAGDIKTRMAFKNLLYHAGILADNEVPLGGTTPQWRRARKAPSHWEMENV